MSYDAATKLSKILDEHPWLEKELPKRYPELKSMDNAASRFMLRRMTVKDASKLSGISEAKLLKMLTDLIGEVERKR